jgi:hypothetical protein
LQFADKKNHRVAAHPVKIDGRVLGDEGFDSKEMASGGTE